MRHNYARDVKNTAMDPETIDKRTTMGSWSTTNNRTITDNRTATDSRRTINGNSAILHKWMAVILAAVLGAGLLSGCSKGLSNGLDQSEQEIEEITSEQESQEGAIAAENLESATAEENQEESQKGESEMKLTITVGDQTFQATMENNRAASAFADMLPLSINMTELNGNEKYANLSTAIHEENATNPGTIHAGDIMLFGSDCLVFFYESFTTGYSYVPLAKVDDVTGFAAALGAGSVDVTIALA